MKKILTILFLLPCFLQAQTKCDTAHVHYFKWTSLGQCDMGSYYCLVAHYTISPCACGAVFGLANLIDQPGFTHTEIITDSSIKEGLKRGDTLGIGTASPMPFPFVHAPYVPIDPNISFMKTDTIYLKSK